MTSLLLSIATLAPLAGALALIVFKLHGLRPGRVMASACGLGAMAALVLLGWTATTTTNLLGQVLGLGVRLDRAAATLVATILSTGAVVASFARRNVDVDPRANRFFTLFGVLVSGSTLIVLHGAPWLLLVGWVASTWAFVGLIGYDAASDAAKAAQRRTALALSVGDVALVAAVAVAMWASDVDVTTSVAVALDDLRATTLVDVRASDIVAVLLVVAGMSRSSLMPFHRWLAATLAAPTPVSALVHAGFVSAAGLLMIRFSSLILDSNAAIYLAFVVGVATTVVAVGAATTRVDVKGKLAWSTVSQMGFMVVQCAVGAFSSALVHIVGHGMYKASMFLGAGDAVSAGLRSKRRATPLPVLPVQFRVAASILIATAVVAAAILAIPPDVSDGGVILIVVFACLTVGHGVWGWLSKGALAVGPSTAVATMGGLVAAFAYFGGLRAMEAFLNPVFGDVARDAGVNLAVLIGVLAATALLTAAFTVSAKDTAMRGRLSAWLERVAHPGVAGPLHPLRASTKPATGGVTAPTSYSADGTVLAKTRADVAQAQRVIAPSWPLTSFVAVNPLGGLEQKGFDQASEAARNQMRVRTHLSLADFRRDHADGATSSDDLRWAINAHFMELCAGESLLLGGRSVSVAEIIELDLLHGPELTPTFEPQTALERAEGVDGPVGALIDQALGHSAAQYVTTASSDGINGVFGARWRRDATAVAAYRHHLSNEAVQWLLSLSDDPAEVLTVSLHIAEVDDSSRVAEIRGHLMRLRGWAGFARWRTEWAQAGETRPLLAPIEIAAARCALEAAWLLSHSMVEGAVPGAPRRDEIIEQHDRCRVMSVLSAIGVEDPDPDAYPHVTNIIAQVAEASRPATWLTAQERKIDQALLGQLDRLDPGRRLDGPAAQLAFCIDVRSEGLRRHLEGAGPYETLGFAGFFGVPMSIRRMEWADAEPRCPVLVAPSVAAIERPPTNATADDVMARSQLASGIAAVHNQTKVGAGAPFAMAEAAGWLAGPRAAVRTLLPGRASEHDVRDSVMELDRSPDGGVGVEQRIDIGEAVLRTMGLIDRFAPLVVLCGHTSAHLNNPHATALDCGACAGASGEDNARAVAALLNETAVRDGLRDRNIDIPNETHFLPGLHETVSDRVDLLDLGAIPARHRKAVEQLVADLEIAASQQAAHRSQHLPGPSALVQHRGADWAQVRPEWGLARNAAFVIGPRSITEGLDLDGRAFLHSYDADNDPHGKTLETIMTAPLVVAHWISSQYYFSSVDPEAFGAGDKLMHNIVGDVGVISGEHGDLRVGLPTQSTHLGAERHHQPVRLLAVVQAPLDQIERIIQQNPILSTLIGGSWMRIAGRSHPHERWSIRTAAGTWSAEPRPHNESSTSQALEHA